MPTTPLPHPMQPVFVDDQGVARFKPNALVEYLLDHGRLDMNALAIADASQEDREQFAQLIGYSVGGFSELSYVRHESAQAAWRMAESDGQLDPTEAALAEAKATLQQLRLALRDPVAALYGLHPDDLWEVDD